MQISKNLTSQHLIPFTSNHTSVQTIQDPGPPVRGEQQTLVLTGWQIVSIVVVLAIAATLGVEAAAGGLYMVSSGIPGWIGCVRGQRVSGR